MPQWFLDAKFGIFIHWGVYSVPASGSEWYPKHMYNALLREHTQKWGAPGEFGYKDFVPLFRAEKFDPAAWAALFEEAGACYVIPTAEHHDGFALYQSDLTQWDAVDKGPRRDLIGDLAAAVRARGMHFGVSNHRIENWDFMWPTDSAVRTSCDLFDHAWADLYGPPQKPTKNSGMGPDERSNPNALTDEHHPQSEAFLEEWLTRAQEIIDKYHPVLYYFDNGINYRSLDPWKLRFAAYYYNAMQANAADDDGGNQCSIQSKSEAYLTGSIRDYERMSRAPKEITAHYWQVDDPIGHKFGYVEGLRLQNAEGIVRSLVNNISRNGNLCLNISPRANGTIPDDQQAILRAIGRWLKVNGEGAYGTSAWTDCPVLPGVNTAVPAKPATHSTVPTKATTHNAAAAKTDVSAEDNLTSPDNEGSLGAGGLRLSGGEGDLRFTAKGNSVYVFALRWERGDITVRSLALRPGLKVKRVAMLGGAEVKFTQTDKALTLHLPDGIKNPNEPGFCVCYRVEVEPQKVLFIGDSITDGGWGRSGGSATPSEKRNSGDLNHRCWRRHGSGRSGKPIRHGGGNVVVATIIPTECRVF